MRRLGEAGSAPSFGAILRQRRELRGLSLRRLAALVAYSPGWLSKIETGVAVPTPQLAQACDLELAAGGELVALAQAASVERGGLLRPAQLPVGAAVRFVGRDPELDALDGFLALADQAGATMTATIDGPPGVGKTALAIRWAHRVAERFPDGVLFTDLHGYSPEADQAQPGQVLEDFLTAFGMPADSIPPGVVQRAAMVRSLVDDRRVLVLLDNAADSRQAAPLLLGAVGCAVVVTSRRRLAGVAVRADALRVTLGPMPFPDSLALLTSVVGEDRTRAEPEAVRGLAQRCGHLPLALRIAADRVVARPHHAVAELVTALSTGRDPLELLTADDDENVAVRSAFSWSYRELCHEAAWMFRLLGLFPGAHISTPAAAALTGTSTTHARWLLERLASVHLLEEVGCDRYQFHDLLRAYAAERAADEESGADRDAAVRRLIDWYLHSVDAATRTLAPQRPVPRLRLPVDVQPMEFSAAADARCWCDSELPNFVPVTRLAADCKLAAAWQLPVRLWNWLLLCKPWTVWITSHEIGLQAARAAEDPGGVAWVATNLAEAYRQREQLDTAQQHYEQALAIRQRLGDRHDHAWTLAGLGFVAVDRGHTERASAYFRRALGMFEEISDRHGQAVLLASLAEATGRRGRSDDALRCFENALALFTEIGDLYGQGWALVKFADIRRRWGEWGKAVECLDQCVTIRREAGDDWGEAEALDHRSHLFVLMGKHRRVDARTSWQRALHIFEKLNDPHAADVREHLLDLGQEGEKPPS